MSYENWIAETTKYYRDNGVVLYMPFPSKRITNFLAVKRHKENMVKWRERGRTDKIRLQHRFERIVWLESQHTRELMDLLASARRCGGSYQLWDYSNAFTVDEIKEVLATREHIPNKKEGKRLRREAAKRKR